MYSRADVATEAAREICSQSETFTSGVFPIYDSITFYRTLDTSLTSLLWNFCTKIGRLNDRVRIL